MCGSPFSPSLTLLFTDHSNGAGKLQAGVSIGVESPRRTLNPWAGLEVDRIQSDGLGVGEESICVHLPHGAGHSIRPGGGADQPAVLSESVVDVLRRADGTGFVKVVVLRVASLREMTRQTATEWSNKSEGVCVCVCGSRKRLKNCTHRHAHDRVSIGRVGLVFGFSCVVVHEQGNHLGHGREGDICHTVHLLDVDNGLVHLERGGKATLNSQTPQNLRNNCTEHYQLQEKPQYIYFRHTTSLKITGSWELLSSLLDNHCHRWAEMFVDKALCCV